MHDMPPFLEESIREARKSLEIGNYKSCVVMCRRGLEALLKYAYKAIDRTRSYRQEWSVSDSEQSDPGIQERGIAA